MVLENDCHTASLTPHFDIVHAVIPYLDPTLRKRLRAIHETARLRITFVESHYVCTVLYI